MNILFVVEVDWMRKPVYDMQLLAESLSAVGHKVYVVDYESMWDSEVSFKEADVSVALPESRVRLIRPSFIKVPMVSRASAVVSQYFALRKVMEAKKIDAVILYAVPTNGLSAVHWAKKLGIPIVFRSIDVLHKLLTYPVLNTITKVLEKRVYASVDKIFTITPKLSDYVVSMGAKRERVTVLPMTLNTDIFHYQNTNGHRQKWGCKLDDSVILYMGTIFEFSGLDKFIPLLPKIIEKVPNAKLLIVGDGQQRPVLEKMINQLNLWDRVIITGFKPYQDMPLFINAADVCINTFQDTPVTRDIFPGKTVQFLACCKPLVATKLAGMQAVVEGKEQGVIYTDNVESMVEPIVHLLRNRKDRFELGFKGEAYSHKYHGCYEVAHRLGKELESLVHA